MIDEPVCGGERMDRQIVFVETYRCRGCETELQAIEPLDESWLRCPSCGRPGLPPLSSVMRAAAHMRTAAENDGELFIIRDTDVPRTSRFTWTRFVLFCIGVALPVAICMATVDDPGEAAVLGVVSAVALAFLLFGRSRR
jgi:hypothetical protein